MDLKVQKVQVVALNQVEENLMYLRLLVDLKVALLVVVVQSLPLVENSSSSSSSSSKSSSSSSTSGNFKSGSYSSSVDKGKSGTTKGFSSGSYSSKNDTDTTQDKDYNSSTSYDDSGGSFFGDMMFGLNSLRMFSYGRGGRGFSIGSIIIMAVIFMIVIKLIRLYLKNRKY